MAERFCEVDLQQLLAIVDACEARIENGAPIANAFNWCREELVNYHDGGAAPYETAEDAPGNPASTSVGG